MMPVAPASQRPAISRSTEGTGVWAPAPVRARPVLQRPGQTAALPGLGGRRVHRGDHHAGRQSGIDRGDQSHHDAGGVLAAAGRAFAAPRLPIPVAGGHRADVAASRARFTFRPADVAVPVLATALHRAKRLAAAGAGR